MAYRSREVCQGVNCKANIQRELHKRYCEIKANPMTFDLQTIDIEHEYPILGRAYRKLGIQELKRLRTITHKISF